MNGIMNVYKEKGYTSHDVVAKLRGILKQKKIGHTGTLDPDAEGVLPICLGNGTKLCDILTDKDKTYDAVILLGTITDTQDVTGSIISEKEVTASEKETEAVIKSYIGEYDQIPPMYSALKVNGKKLYELAREGKVIDRKPRRVRIKDIRIIKIDMQNKEAVISVDCSKGTYIRTLCEDIGNSLGCGGCMKSLKRTRVGRFKLSDSIKLSDIEEAVKAGRIEEYVMPVDKMFLDIPETVVKESDSKLIYNGNIFKNENLETLIEEKDGQKVRVYDYNKKFVGIYEYNLMEKYYKPFKMFL